MFAPTREIGSRWSEVEFPANVGSRGITGRTLDRFDQCGIRRTHVLRAERPAAIRAMLSEGLTLPDVVTWTDGETNLEEATRLAELDQDGAGS